MTSNPDPSQCITLLIKNGCSKEVINHCKAVRDVAIRIAMKSNADIHLVEAGALLHDIGRAKNHGIQHGIIGAKIAKDNKLPIRIINIIERHIGAGIPKDEAVELGLPAKDYLPKTLEEKIVAHADNLIDKGKKQHLETEINRALKNGQKNHAKRLKKLHSELSTICRIDLNEI
jgi:uncharacterized protein (TIGR00295 family)